MKEENDFRINVIGEVMSVTGFQAENTYVMFQMLLPEHGGWLFEDSGSGDHDELNWNSNSEYNRRKCVT